MLSFVREICKRTSLAISNKELSVIKVPFNKLSQTNDKPNQDKEKYVPIYKFKYIQIFSVINRLKIYQLGLTATTVPGCIILNQLNICSIDDILFAAGIGLSGCATLFSIGHFAKDFVGLIYYNKSENKAKISYTDNWGRRKDIEVPINDIVPFSEQKRSFLDGVFLNLERYSTKDKLRINVTQADIMDRNIFKSIFSDVEIMNKK